MGAEMFEYEKVIYYNSFVSSGFGALAKQENYAYILPSDTGSVIIRKAAGVVSLARQLRWQQLELTAFFYFGINTFTSKVWGNGQEDPKLFNPSSLDANQWVKVAKQSVIKQVILTAKRHDGFCFWPTNTTQHLVSSSPWKNGKGDIVREVA
jgi:alpha-L-fucosidase